jgi:hypothetical protein
MARPLNNFYFNPKLYDFLEPTGWPKEVVISKSKSEVLIGASVLIGGFLLPILLSCVIYLAMICRKRKYLTNKIEVLDDDIIHSENQIPGIFALASLNETNPNESLLTDNAEILISKKEFDSYKTDNNFGCNQVTEEPNDQGTSTSGIQNTSFHAQSDDNIQDQNPEIEKKFQVSVKSICTQRGTILDHYDSINNADNKNQDDIDLLLADQNKITQPQINTNIPVLVEVIQCANKDNNLLTQPQEEQKSVKESSVSYPTNNTDSDEKTEAQILAAKRSLITNLVVIGQSLLVNMAIPFLKKNIYYF